MRGLRFIVLLAELAAKMQVRGREGMSGEGLC